MANKAVILGCNYYIGLSVLRCLGQYSIHTVAVDYSDTGAYAARSRYVKERLIAPYYKEDKEAFVNFLIDYAKGQKSKPVLFPCHDNYVEIIDEYLPELREHYLISQTEQGLFHRVMDKGELYKLAIEKGFLVPESLQVDNPDLHKLVASKIKYPCVVKPVDSPAFVAKFRKKMFIVKGQEELDQAIAKAQAENFEVIVQRIIPGFDDHMYTFDAHLNQDGKVSHWVTCQKQRQYPINFGASVYTMQRYVPEIVDIGKKFLEQIEYKGFAEIEFKKDSETGNFYLIEVNARTTNLNNLLAAVGVNFPYVAYSELVGISMENRSVKKDTGKVFWYAYEDFLAVRDYIRADQLSLGEIIKSYSKPKVYAIWSWKDPKPFFDFLQTIWQRKRKRKKKR